MANLSAASAVLSVRVNPAERALLEEAADQAKTSLSDFIRRKAVEAAEAALLERSTVTIPAADWEAFESWLVRPATPIAAIETLAKQTPTWRR